MKTNLIFTLVVTSCFVLYVNRVSCHEHKDHKDKLDGAGKQKRGIADLKDAASSSESSESSEKTKRSLNEVAEIRIKRATEDMKQNFEGGMKKMMDGLKDTINVFQGFLASKDKKERKKRGTEDIKESFEGGAKKLMGGAKDTIGVFQGFLGGKKDREKRQNDMKDKIKGKIQEFVGKAKGFLNKGDKNGESVSSSGGIGMGRKKRGIADVETPAKIGEDQDDEDDSSEESTELTKTKRQAEELDVNETGKGETKKGKGKGKKGGKDASELADRKKRCISEQATSIQSSDQPAARKRRLVHYDARQAFQKTYTLV